MITMVKDDAKEVLKNYIEESGLKKGKVAEKLGITSNQLSNRLTGRAKFDADFALLVSKKLNISPEKFLK